MTAELVIVALGALCLGAGLGGAFVHRLGRRAASGGDAASPAGLTPLELPLPDAVANVGERLEMALDATGAAVWDADLVAGTCWWSETFPRMLGYADTPAMPFDFWEKRLHPEDRERVLAHIAAHLAGETTSYDYDYRMRREDGGWMWIAAKGRAFRDGTGRVVRYAGIMTDITEARRQAERLRASEERLLKIMQATPIAVNVTTRDGRWLFCNAQSVHLLGRDHAELMRTPTPQLYADPAERAALIARFDREGPFRDAEIRFRKPDGGVVWTLSSWDQIELDGEAALLTWLYDITDRKSAEATSTRAREEAERALGELRAAQESLIQAETMASLGQLVAGVAHEINTPIGIALTAASHIGEQAQMLNDRFAGGTLRKSDFTDFLAGLGEGVRLLMANIDRAAALVQSFKQVAVDQSSGDRRVFDLGGYVAEILFSLRPRLKRTRLTVALDCAEDLTMDSYPGALGQVLTNLVINAVLHAYPDGGAGTIRIAAQPDGPDRVRIDFLDDGAGIPPENLSKVFEPFFTTKRGQGGSGLGLHIVFNTVTGPLGGTVAVQSWPGRGTRFTLHLPREAPVALSTPAVEAALP
ncbi:PAS domain-containing sensor histidine kinase [Azospirillum doebereinerae]